MVVKILIHPDHGYNSKVSTAKFSYFKTESCLDNNVPDERESLQTSHLFPVLFEGKSSSENLEVPEIVSKKNTSFRGRL